MSKILDLLTYLLAYGCGQGWNWMWWDEVGYGGVGCFPDLSDLFPTRFLSTFFAIFKNIENIFLCCLWSIRVRVRVRVKVRVSHIQRSSLSRSRPKSAFMTLEWLWILHSDFKLLYFFLFNDQSILLYGWAILLLSLWSIQRYRFSAFLTDKNVIFRLQFLKLYLPFPFSMIIFNLRAQPQLKSRLRSYRKIFQSFESFVSPCVRWC